MLLYYIFTNNFATTLCTGPKDVSHLGFLQIMEEIDLYRPFSRAEEVDFSLSNSFDSLDWILLEDTVPSQVLIVLKLYPFELTC